jgi:hypothetical protein
MKVVFVNRFFHPDHSATSQMLSDLALSLAGAGHDIHVVTSHHRYDLPDAPLPPRETVDGVTVTRICTTRFGRFNLAGRELDYVTSYGADGACHRTLAGVPAPTRRGGPTISRTEPVNRPPLPRSNAQLLIGRPPRLTHRFR